MDRAKVPQPAPPGFSWSGPQYPRICPGTYSVVGKAWQGPSWILAFRRWGIRIEFSLLSGEGDVSLFCNLGNREGQPHIGRGSLYFKWWVAANGTLPDRAQAMSPDVFLEGQIFEVEIDDARLDKKKEVKDEAEIYSRIVRLVGVTRPGNAYEATRQAMKQESTKHAIK